MKVTGFVEKSENSKVSSEDLELIGKYTSRKFSEDELYTFSLTLCDNEIDRDLDKFSIPALHKLAELFIGKTGIFDHKRSASNQSARIYKTEVVSKKDTLTKDGEVYHCLSAKAYMIRSKKNEDLILEIEGGIKKEVSVSCKVESLICSVCGKDRAKEVCRHTKGKTYSEGSSKQLCFNILDDPSDAYEWSFVAVPAQKAAGVTKNYSLKEEKNLQTIEKLLCEDADEVVLSSDDKAMLKNYISTLEKRAEIGEEMIKGLRDEVVGLCASHIGMASLEMEAICKKLSFEDLVSLKKAMSQKEDSEPKIQITGKTENKEMSGKLIDFRI